MKKNFLLLISVLFISGTANLTIAQVYKAILSGVQETPPVLTKASGVITASLKGDTLIVTGGFEGLSSPYLFSHIHSAITGTPGPIIFTLNASMPTDTAGGYLAGSNKFILTAQQLALLAQRKLYVNVHSKKHPSGEIRGQLIPESDNNFFTNLYGISETPPVLTAASGAITAEIIGTKLIISGSFTNLSSAYTASHIHVELAGRAGPILFPLVSTIAQGGLSGTFEAIENTFTLTAAQLDSLNENKFYVNVHSTLHPSGEIRGQLILAPTAQFHAILSGGSENPSVNTASTGHYIVSLYKNEIEITGSFQDLTSPFLMAHIHEAIFGTNGPIRVTINPTLSTNKLSGKNNRQNAILSDAQIDLLYKRKMYINVHSEIHPGGEIRGQLLPPANYYFNGKLQGYNELTPTPIAENGGTVVEWLGDSIILSGSFRNLKSKFNRTIGTHIHQQETGVNGPIIFHLNPDVTIDSLNGLYEADSNRFVLNPSQKTALANKQLYVNVHTIVNPGGEVRGQLMPELNFFPTASDIQTPANEATVIVGGNPATPFEVNFTDATDPDGDKVVYIWQLATDRNFSDVLVTANTGISSSFSTTIGAIDAILEAQGVPVNSTVKWYHRVITTEGSLLNYSDTLSVNLTRSTITSINNKSVKGEFRIYPNPATENVSVESSNQNGCKVQMVDILGKVIIEKPLTAEVDLLNLSEVDKGLYFINVMSDNQVIKSERLLVK